MLAWIGLGSNLGDCVSLLRSALNALARLPNSELLAVSPFYRSAALQLPGDNQQHPDYCNAVAAIRSGLQPEELLQHLLRIELAHGRDRGAEQRWQSRSLDLDLLAVGQQRVHTATLNLPHAELHKRDFVLQPWADLAAGHQLPGVGSVGDCYRTLETQPLKHWA